MKLYITIIKIYLEKLRKNLKTSYYQRKLKLLEGDIKKTWKIVKEVIGNKKGTYDSFPPKSNNWQSRNY